MKIHMLGHASIFVETQNCKILMDPLLWDSHGEGIENVCPKREVILEQIPEFDLLILSHRHLDHFDIRSLAYLPKTVDVLIPNDEFLKTCLHKLGYSQVYCLSDFSEVKIGSTTLLTTRSENRVPEYGIVFADESEVFWNQVDTVVSLETIRFIKSRYRQVDFLLATWQPFLEINYQTNKSLSFPYYEYNQLLENISLIKPKAIAPGANGFKLINESSWLNQIIFPVTHEQFCKDVEMILPEIGKNIFTLDPGDILALQNGEFSKMQAMCQFVKKLEDDRESLDFSPVNIGSNLEDDNIDNYDQENMRRAIEEEVHLNIPRFIMDKKDSLFIEHCRWKVIYQLEIVFSDSCSRWFFDFSEENIQVKVGRNPLSNIFTKITASSFYSILKRLKGWDYAYMSGHYRSFKKIYAVTEYGIAKPLRDPLEDILAIKFPYKEIFESIRNLEIEKWNQNNTASLVNKNHNNSMLRMGKHLIKVKS
jgi:UDP-MurNAc hydroxylase